MILTKLQRSEIGLCKFQTLDSITNGDTDTNIMATKRKFIEMMFAEINNRIANDTFSFQDLFVNLENQVASKIMLTLEQYIPTSHDITLEMLQDVSKCADAHLERLFKKMQYNLVQPNDRTLCSMLDQNNDFRKMITVIICNKGAKFPQMTQREERLLKRYLSKYL